jgi:hypothetical protein
MTGTNFSSWYRADEGTVYSDFVGVNNISGGTRRVVEIGTAGENRMIVGYSAVNNTRFLTVANNTTQADIQVSGISNAGSPVKLIATYKVNDFQQSTNATLGTADTSAIVPVVGTQLAIGTDTGLGATANTVLNGTIKKIAYYGRRLSNAELQGLTTI